MRVKSTLYHTIKRQIPTHLLMEVFFMEKFLPVPAWFYWLQLPAVYRLFQNIPLRTFFLVLQGNLTVISLALVYRRMQDSTCFKVRKMGRRESYLLSSSPFIRTFIFKSWD